MLKHLALPILTAQRMTQRGPWLALGGLILLLVSVRTAHGFGFVTGLMLVFCGTLAFCFRLWLRERGLWMLAAIAFLVFGMLYAMIEYDNLKQRWNGNGRWWALLDGALAGIVVLRTVRFLLTVVMVNRQLSNFSRVVVIEKRSGGVSDGD